MVELPYITTRLYHQDGTVSVDISYIAGEEYVSTPIVQSINITTLNCLCPDELSFAIYLLPYKAVQVVKLLHNDTLQEL